MRVNESGVIYEIIGVDGNEAPHGRAQAADVRLGI